MPQFILREYPLAHNRVEVIMMYERIRNMREDKDMTQAQMAEFLSIHQTTYSDYELGNLNIPVQVLDKVADLFETSIDYLVDRTDEKTPYPCKK